jgi:hypothetical protein
MTYTFSDLSSGLSSGFANLSQWASANPIQAIGGAGIVTATLIGTYKARASLLSKKGLAVIGSLAAGAAVGGVYFGIIDPNSIKNAASAYYTALEPTLSKTIDSIKNTASEYWTALEPTISKTIDSIRNTASEYWTALEPTISKTIDSANKWISDQINLASLWDGVRQGASYASAGIDLNARAAGSAFADFTRMVAKTLLAIGLTSASVAGVAVGSYHLKKHYSGSDRSTSSSTQLLPNETFLSNCNLIDKNGALTSGTVTIRAENGKDHIRIRNDKNLLVAELTVDVDYQKFQILLKEVQITGKTYNNCKQILLDTVKSNYQRFTISNSEVLSKLAAV